MDVKFQLVAATISETTCILDSVFEGTLGVRLPDCLQPQKSSFSSEFLPGEHNSLKIMNKIFLTPFRGYMYVDRSYSSCHDEYPD